MTGGYLAFAALVLFYGGALYGIYGKRPGWRIAAAAVALPAGGYISYLVIMTIIIIIRTFTVLKGG